MLQILLACVAMAIRDALGTMLVISESHGRDWYAGTFDALGDIASVGVTVLGAGVVIQHGLTWHAVLVLAAMCVTSFFGTTFWTHIGRKLKPAEAPTYMGGAAPTPYVGIPAPPFQLPKEN